MKAIVVERPGGPEVLQIQERPMPKPRPDWVLVHVRGFGLNHSELLTRQGESGDAVKFPRVLGIEAVGEVVDAPDGDLRPGQKFVAVMGGMGRDFDGSYAEYTLLPRKQVIPIETKLSWQRLAMIPETFATAWGSLDTLQLQAGQSLLIRGGSSSVGMAATAIAHDRGITVIATTRHEQKRAALQAVGADHVVIDNGEIAQDVRHIVPDGVHAALELVGPKTMLETLQAIRTGGSICLTGYLEGEWNAEKAKREAKRLNVTFHQFNSSVVNVDTYRSTMQDIVRHVEDGRYHTILDHTFGFTDIAEAHRYMEANRAVGKVVVLTPSA
jgi:NADPH2:quinone reductase